MLVRYQNESGVTVEIDVGDSVEVFVDQHRDSAAPNMVVHVDRAGLNVERAVGGPALACLDFGDLWDDACRPAG